MALLTRLPVWPFLICMLAVLCVESLVPSDLLAQSPDQGEVTLECPDKVVVSPAKRHTFICIGTNTTDWASKGYHLFSRQGPILKQHPDGNIPTPSIEGVFFLEFGVTTAGRQTRLITATVGDDSPSITKARSQERVDVAVRYGPLHHVGLALLWVQGAILAFGLVWAIPAAIIGARLAQERNAEWKAYAKYSAWYSALLFLPWAYWYAKSMGKSLSERSIAWGYHLLYLLWATFALQFFIAAVLQLSWVISLGVIRPGQIFPPYLGLFIYWPLTLLAASLVFWWMQRAISDFPNAANIDIGTLNDAPAGNIPYEYYAPFKYGLVTMAVTWIGFCWFYFGLFG